MRGLLTIAIVLCATAALALAPDSFWGMVFNTVLPTLSDKQSTVWQATSAGKLNVSGLAPLVPCTAGQLDFSVTTGCNTTFMVMGLP